MSKEAMKLALKALEWINRVNAMDYEYQQKARESLNAIYEALADQSIGCQCPACEKTSHASDCAVHSAPAYPVGKCDCGAQPYPENFIDALKYDVARRDSESAQQEPVDSTQISKVWWDGEKLMAEPIDPTTIYQEPAQEKYWNAVSDAHIAAIKKSSKAMVEDAVVRAVHKVMAEFEAKSDERLMEDWGPGPHEHHSLPARGPEQKPVALPEKIYEFVPTPEPAKWHHPECEGECIACLIERVVQEAYGSQGLSYLQRHLTSPPAQQEPLTGGDERRHIICLCPDCIKTPQRKPLTHEQRVDLLAKFEAHKHEWHAPAILIDMVEAAHGIKGDA